MKAPVRATLSPRRWPGRSYPLPTAHCPLPTAYLPYGVTPANRNTSIACQMLGLWFFCPQARAGKKIRRERKRANFIKVRRQGGLVGKQSGEFHTLVFPSAVLGAIQDNECLSFRSGL